MTTKKDCAMSFWEGQDIRQLKTISEYKCFQRALEEWKYWRLEEYEDSEDPKITQDP